MNTQPNPNLSLYNAVRQVPQNAIKPIESGRLKGKSDINPMWRIKTLTEQFGPCGIGWWYEITNQRLEPHGSFGEVAAFVDIRLYYKMGDQTSQPIPGIGGSTFIAAEKTGLHMDDEAFKKALTDAISVAAKAIGVGADVYFSKDATKYSAYEDAPEAPAAPPAPKPLSMEDALAYILRDTPYAGTTIKELYKTHMRDVEIVYNTTTDQTAKYAIRVVQDEIAKKKAAAPAPAAPEPAPTVTFDQL